MLSVCKACTGDWPQQGDKERDIGMSLVSMSLEMPCS